MAVVAHPDDESFGLGAVLAALADAGARVRVVCLTHGEASTLGATEDLAVVREHELRSAAAVLGIDDVVLLDYADGHVEDLDIRALCERVGAHVRDADLVVAFDGGGVTGHPDHRAATATARALAEGRRVPLLEWGVRPDVASTLRTEFGAPFVGLSGARGAELLDIEVDRTRQLDAIACHGSQAIDNPVLARRLELQGSWERVRLTGRSPLAHDGAPGAPCGVSRWSCDGGECDMNTNVTLLASAAIHDIPAIPFGGMEGVSQRVLWRDGSSSAGVLSIRAGHRLGVHTHRSNHHHLWVTDGSARVMGSVLGRGSYAHIPSGVEHDIDATGTGGCTVFYLYIAPE